MALADHTLFYEPDPKEHVIISYHDVSRLTDLAATFFNEGLNRNQLCIYASMHLDNGVLEELSSKIKNYAKHVQNENLLIVDLKPFHNAIMVQNLVPFFDLKKSVLLKKLQREDKHIRIWGDLVSYLFEQKKFDECMLLEQWWQKNPLGGTVVCPYRTEVLNDPIYESQKDQVLNEHDKVILC